jgi:ubiquinone/menaquinone biosynthesis C-methylase UbiE
MKNPLLHSMKNDKAYQTAITRRAPSAPMQKLASLGLLKGQRMLDYGCGKGVDANHYKMDKYDPHFYPLPVTTAISLLANQYDVITCNYVLNVVEETVVKKILKDIRTLLKEDGVAYISVRRDIKNEGFTKKGTLQRNVVLELPIIHEKKRNYCIYRMTKKDEGI